VLKSKKSTTQDIPKAQAAYVSPLKTKKLFSKVTILVVAMICGGIGVYLLRSSFASSRTTNIYSCPQVNGSYLTLKLGSKDGDTGQPGERCVSAIQWAFSTQANQHQITVTGVFDQATQSGVINFQRFFRYLKVDGVLTPTQMTAVTNIFGPFKTDDGRYWGIQIHSVPPTDSQANLVKDLDSAVQLGAKAVRAPISWRGTEWNAKNQYDQSYVAGNDTLMREAHARNLKVIATIADTPKWASNGQLWNNPPTNPSDMGDFASYFAGRYKSLDPDTLVAIEVWNEPEINNNLISSNVAASYTAMVKAVYTSVKSGKNSDPSVQILAGAMSYADTSFLSKLYADNIKGFYDGISFHPYADGADPANLAVVHSFLGGIQAMHTFQQNSGDTTAQWITEFGWPTGTSTSASTTQQQATYSAKAFSLMKSLPYVKAGTMYQLRNQAVDPANPEDNFGVLQNDYTKQPAFATVQSQLHSQ